MAIDTTITTILTTTPSPTTKILRSQTARSSSVGLVWPHEKMKQHGGNFRGAPLAVVWLYTQDQRSLPLESGFATMYQDKHIISA